MFSAFGYYEGPIVSQDLVQLFAPDVYPKTQSELRAYTIASFRVAQASNQLTLVPMSRPVLEFLIKRRALDYWIGKNRVIRDEASYRLTPEGIFFCESALAEQLPTHNTTAEQVDYWVNQFTSNDNLPRRGSFQL